MPFSAKKGTLTAPTSGSAPVSQSVNVGFAPKLILFFWTYQGSEGFSGGDIGGIQGFGAASSSSQRGCASYAANDNTSPSVAGSRADATKCISLLSNGAPTIVGEADLSSMDSDGFTLSWATIPSTAAIVHYLALGGSDITNAKVGNFQLPTATGTFDVTDPGFEPDSVLLFSIRNTTLTSSATVTRWTLGAFDRAAEANATLVEANAVATTDMASAQLSTRVLRMLGTSTGYNSNVDFSAMLSNGFRLNNVTAPGGAYHAFYIALRGVKVKLGVETQKTSTGTKATTVGFNPSALLLWGTNRAASTAIDATQQKFSIGATDGTASGTTWASSTDNVTTTDANSSTVTGKVIRHATNPSTIDAEATVSFDSSGFTLDWTTADATAREFFYLAIGTTSVPIGLVSETDTPQSLGSAKAKVIGQISEADAPLLLTARKAKTLGQVSETEVLLPMTARKTKTIGLVTEAENPLALSARKTRTLGQVVEVDTALALVRLGASPGQFALIEAGDFTALDAGDPILPNPGSFTPGNPGHFEEP
jgi:hypothetical protein